MTPSSPSPEAVDTSRQGQSTEEATVNVFSDEYALDEVDVADGFDRNRSLAGLDRRENRPSQSSPAAAASSSQVHPERRSRNTRSMDKSTIQASQPVVDGRHSFSLRHDGQTGEGNGRTIQPTSHRVNGRSSNTTTNGAISNPDRAVLRAQSPFQGGSGPSFPYALYPQQNTIPDLDPPLHLANSTVPVGFSDHQDAYRRRIGPEGEDIADMIGPYGHTEQLPPYSRYAGAMPLKENEGLTPHSPDFATAPTPFISTDSQSPPVLPLDLNRSIAPEHPRQSPDFARSPVSSSHSMRSSTSGTRLNSQVDASNEKGFFKEKRRICGTLISLRLILLSVVILVVTGAIVGGTIGAAVGRRRAQQQSVSDLANKSSAGAAHNNAVASTVFTSTVQVTKTYDAISMTSSPTGVVPPATGQWSLPWDPPSSQGNACVPSDESAAWSCNVGDFLVTMIEIDTSKDGILRKISIINEPLQPGFLPKYGTVALNALRNQTLHWATDADDQSLGPAAFFQAQYDKVVIVPQNALNVSVGNQRRDTLGPSSSELGIRNLMMSQVAEPGQTPWVCIWNDTLVEGFVYVAQNASIGELQPSSQPSSAQVSAAAAARKTGTGPGASLSDPLATPGAPGPPIVKGPYGPNRKRDGTTSTLSSFPTKIKIEERRDPDRITVSPYCQQMQVLDDGTFGSVLDDHNNPIIISLNEEKGSYKLKEKRRNEERSTDEDVSKCQCQWFMPN